MHRKAIADLMVALGRSMLVNPTWLEVDINPVMASSTGAFAVDALIVADVSRPDWDYEDPGGTSPRA